jgi:hypothetical protein
VSNTNASTRAPTAHTQIQHHVYPTPYTPSLLGIVAL